MLLTRIILHAEIRYSFLVLEGRNQFFPKELRANDVQLPAINAV